MQSKPDLISDSACTPGPGILILRGYRHNQLIRPDPPVTLHLIRSAILTTNFDINHVPTGAREARVQAFKDDYPLVKTGGKGAVVFRYDHGLRNLREHLLPLHQETGIPFYVAMNSRLWSDDENYTVSYLDVRRWLDSGIAEFGNHTADHKDRTSRAWIWESIVEGRKELEDQLWRTIHGFTVPGVVGFNKFEGFGSGTLDTYTETYAGGLILANHAVCSGTIGSIHRPLDGVLRIGTRHYTWEKASWTDIKTQIDRAVTTSTAMTIMAHPRNLGRTGYYDTALARRVIDYVAGLISHGQLANISYYQSHHATTGN